MNAPSLPAPTDHYWYVDRERMTVGQHYRMRLKSFLAVIDAHNASGTAGTADERTNANANACVAAGIIFG